MGAATGLGSPAGLDARRHHRGHRGLELLRPGRVRLHAGGARTELPRQLHDDGLRRVPRQFARPSCSRPSRRATRATTPSSAGRAGAGRVLRLRKSFDTRTSLDGVVVEDTLDTTMTVPANGSYEWHINPSRRPMFADPGESWTMTCEAADGTVLASTTVDVARGQAVTRDLSCPAVAAAGRPRAPARGPARRAGAIRPRTATPPRLARARAGWTAPAWAPDGRVLRRRFVRRLKGSRFVDRFCLAGPGLAARGLSRACACSAGWRAANATARAGARCWCSPRAPASGCGASAPARA